MEAIPNIKPIFAIFEPITLPITIPDSPLKVAKILTINSGKLVPKATNVIPTTILGMANFSAMLLLLSIKYSAPRNKKRPPIKNCINSGNILNKSIIYFLGYN